MDRGRRRRGCSCWWWVSGGRGLFLGKVGGAVHEPVGGGEGGLGWEVDVEGVEGGFVGVGEREAGCVEWGGHSCEQREG